MQGFLKKSPHYRPDFDSSADKVAMVIINCSINTRLFGDLCMFFYRQAMHGWAFCCFLNRYVWNMSDRKI